MSRLSFRFLCLSVVHLSPCLQIAHLFIRFLLFLICLLSLNCLSLVCPFWLVIPQLGNCFLVSVCSLVHSYFIVFVRRTQAQAPWQSVRFRWPARGELWRCVGLGPQCRLGPPGCACVVPGSGVRGGCGGAQVRRGRVRGRQRPRLALARALLGPRSVPHQLLVVAGDWDQLDS